MMRFRLPRPGLRSELGWLGMVLTLTVLPVLTSTGVVLALWTLVQEFGSGPGTAVPWFILSAPLMALALTPTTVVAAVSGWMYGWAGFPGVLAAYMLAAAIGREAGTFASRLVRAAPHGVIETLKSRAERRHPVLFTALCRLSPAMTFASVNLVLARLTLRPRDYYLGTALGMLPRTVLVFALGTQAGALQDVLDAPFQAVGAGAAVLILFALSGVGFWWLLRRHDGSETEGG